MNKQELIEYCNVLKESKSRFINCIDVDRIIDTIKQLDEPEKVKVPQCVAEHIKRAKEIGRDLQDAMNSSSIHEEVDQWLYTDNNMDTFARAWLDGYEVEEEKRYLVKFKGFNSSYIILKHRHYGNTWFLGGEQEYEFYRLHHTRKQLEEAGFGWVFSCEGIEMEEVE
nr:MAG TPA: Protein of unknown function (DUF1642) [Caudoviricetes sp.]